MVRAGAPASASSCPHATEHNNSKASTSFFMMFSYCVPGQRRRNSGLVRRTQAQGGLASFQVLTNGPMVTRSNSRRKSCIYIHRVTRNCTWACVVGTVLSCGLSVGQSAKPGAVDVWMHNIQYHYSPQIAAHIQQLRGQFVPTK